MRAVTVLPLVVGLATATYGGSPPGYYPVESYPIDDTSQHARCGALGARRRFDYSQCVEYEECVENGSWKKKQCAEGYSFNDFSGNCRLDDHCATIHKDATCPTPFFRLSCSQLLVCDTKSGAYVRTSCDDRFRNDFSRGCVVDQKCTSPKEAKQCKSGAVRGTVNCRTFSVCQEAKWIRQKCVDKSGVWRAACSECDPEYKAEECVEGDTRKVNRSGSFDGYGIKPADEIDCKNFDICYAGKWNHTQCNYGLGYDPVLKRCTSNRLLDSECNPPVAEPRCHEASRIIPPRSCSTFLQCFRGKWRQMTCPNGTRIDFKNNGQCERGYCEEHLQGHNNHYGVDYDFVEEEKYEYDPIYYVPTRPNGAPMSLPAPAVPPAVAHPGRSRERLQQPAAATAHNAQPAHIRPVPSHTAAPTYPVGPSHHPHTPESPYAPKPSRAPEPVVYPKDLELPRLPGLICEGEFRVADAFDSSFYYDCVDGYLRRRSCPAKSLFDPQQGACLAGFTWKSDLICHENQVIPTAYCGEYRICQHNQWLSGSCPHDWPFMNGQCDKTKSCKAYAPPPPIDAKPACAPASVRPDFQNPAGYLECDYNYNWVKRQCKGQAVFDKRASRCTYDPVAMRELSRDVDYKPTCFEGETRKDEEFCTKYEICHADRFETRFCPYGHGFNGFHCEANYRCSGAPTASQKDDACQESAGLNGLLPDRVDCAFYYQCAHGRWVRRPCAPGTHYNPAIGVCDHVGSVPGCGWTRARPTHY